MGGAMIGDRRVEQGWCAAMAFLARWSDPPTCAAREDLASRAVAEAWVVRGQLRRAGAFHAYVRTIARRLRCREVAEAGRRRIACDVDPDSFAEERSWGFGADPAHQRPTVSVAGRSIAAESLRSWLWRRLRERRDVGSVALQRFCEGFSCAELADRFELTESNLKMRMHRSRETLRREIVRAVADGVVEAEMERSVEGSAVRCGASGSIDEDGVGRGVRGDSANRRRRRSKA
jgi:DNA-directed RNA polymerase specialized sigma24 family protein